MMSFLNGSAYPKDKQFSTSELSHLQSHDVFCWMALKVYGTDNPTGDYHPTEGWSMSLNYYKKWKELAKSGNPTRSDEVIDLISVVMKKE
eukprot:13676679-Ditylum_brightwellii.AAC.1